MGGNESAEFRRGKCGRVLKDRPEMMVGHWRNERSWIVDQPNHAFAEEIQFGLRLLKFGSLFRLAAGIDHLAKTAGMSATERLFERNRNGLRAGKVDCHADPGDGLQEEPMSAGGKDNRQDHKPFA